MSDQAGFGRRDGAPRVGDPDPVDHVEMLDVSRARLRDDHGDIGAAERPKAPACPI
jgi:hypothetical protein